MGGVSPRNTEKHQVQISARGEVYGQLFVTKGRFHFAHLEHVTLASVTVPWQDSIRSPARFLVFPPLAILSSPEMQATMCAAVVDSSGAPGDRIRFVANRLGPR